MKKRYSSTELMEAILDLRSATAHGLAQMEARFNARFDALGDVNGRFAQIDARFDRLEYSMNKRFDSVDLRFDAFERRLSILEAKA